MDSMGYPVSDVTAHLGLRFIDSSTSKNVVLSPYSIQNLLLMFLLAMKDGSPAKKELIQVLGYGEGENSTSENNPWSNERVRSIIDVSHNPVKSGRKEADNCSTQFVNGELLLLNKDFVTLKDGYKNELLQRFNTTIMKYSKKDKLRPQVRGNKWLAKTVMKTFKRLFAAKYFDQNNGTYFLDATFIKGNWSLGFDKRDSRKVGFKNRGKQKKMVPFMRQENDFAYAEFNNELPKPDAAEQESDNMRQLHQLDCKVLEMPFCSMDRLSMSMVIFLPNQKKNFDKLQKALMKSSFNNIYSALNSSRVRVKIPRFSLMSDYDVIPSLVKLGAKSLNGSKPAMFDNMFENTKDAKINAVIHMAKIKVNESETRGAAVSYSYKSSGEYVKFYATHPFLFVVRHKESNMTLMMGRVQEL